MHVQMAVRAVKAGHNSTTTQNAVGAGLRRLQKHSGVCHAATMAVYVFHAA